MDTDVASTTAKKFEPASSKVDWAGIGLYILFAFGISWAIWLGLGAIGVPFVIRVSIGMFGPALTAVLVRLLRHEGFADAGLRLVGRGRRGAWRMYIAAYIVPPLLIALAIGFALLTGVQHWAFAENLQSTAHALTKTLADQHQSLPKGFTAEQLATLSVISSTALAFTLAIPFNMIFTFGEEFGWRGYLLPRLAPLGGVRAAIISSIIWGLWHAPVIILNGYNYPGHPWLGVGMMVIFTVALGMILSWLRFRSGSVWPSTLAHAAFNAQAGFGAILLSSADSLLRAPIGLIGLIPMLLIAIGLAVTGRLRAEPDNVVQPAQA